MSFVSLPVTSGTLHAATRQPDHSNANEHRETPFASLLDTGTGPQLREWPAPPADRSRRSERPAQNNTEPKPAPATKSEARDTGPDAAEAPADPGQDTTKPEAAAPTAVTELAPATEEAILDVSDGVDADTGADKTDAPATPDSATATIPVVTATVVTPTATPVQPPLEVGPASEGDAPVAEASAVAADVAPVAAGPELERKPVVPAGKVTPKVEKSADAATQQPEAKPEKLEAVAPNEDSSASDAKSVQQPKANQPQPQQPVEAHGEHHPASKPKIETSIDASTSTASVASRPQVDAAATATSTATIITPPNAALPGAPVAAASQTAQPAAVPVPVSGIAVEIVTQAREGKNRFEIRLDPPELGRVDVRLDIDGQGNVTSRLVVERQDTLDLLRRESSALERALHDAGLKTGNDGLQFSLRDQGFNNARRDDTGGGRFARAVIPTDTAANPERSNYRLPRLGGLDIRV